MRNGEGIFELADASTHFRDLIVKSVGVCKDKTRSIQGVSPQHKECEYGRTVYLVLLRGFLQTVNEYRARKQTKYPHSRDMQ